MSNSVFTALNKSLSPLNVLSLALGCIIGWGAFVMPSTIFLPNAGPFGTLIAFGCSAILVTIIAVNYSFMIRYFPVAGGAFKYTKDIFGDGHAFFCSWFLGLSYLTIVPLNATALSLVSRGLFSDVLSIGFSYKVAGYTVYSGELIVSTIVLFLFAYLSVFRSKLLGIIQNFTVLMLIISILILLIGSLFVKRDILDSLNPSFSPVSSNLYGILAIISIAPWAFIGFDAIPQVTEESNFSPLKSKLLLILSIGFGAFVYSALTFITALGISDSNGNWIIGIEYANSSVSRGLSSLPTFLAAYNLLGNFGLFVMILAVVSAILSGIMGFYITSSRLFYSMAREGFLPLLFAKVHKKYQIPHWSIAIVMFISILAPFFGRTALVWIVDVASIGASIGFLYTSLSTFKLSKKLNNNIVFLFSIMGIFVSLLFILILLLPISTSVNLSKESYFFLFIWVCLGIVFYFKRKLHF